MHSMADKHTNCTECDSTNLRRIFKTMTVAKQQGTQETGQLVKDYIRDSKKDLKQQRQDLKDRNYK